MKIFHKILLFFLGTAFLTVINFPLKVYKKSIKLLQEQQSSNWHVLQFIIISTTADEVDFNQGAGLKKKTKVQLIQIMAAAHCIAVAPLQTLSTIKVFDPNQPYCLLFGPEKKIESLDNFLITFTPV